LGPAAEYEYHGMFDLRVVASGSMLCHNFRDCSLPHHHAELLFFTFIVDSHSPVVYITAVVLTHIAVFTPPPPMPCRKHNQVATLRDTNYLFIDAKIVSTCVREHGIFVLNGFPDMAACLLIEMATVGLYFSAGRPVASLAGIYHCLGCISTRGIVNFSNAFVYCFCELLG
jgi:hypothetical protein